MLWHSGHAVPADIKARVVAVLDRYFDAIQDTSAWRIYPDPTYAWRHYQGEATTTAVMRRTLEELDAYLNASAQSGWAQSYVGDKAGIVYEAGPDLSRMPDACMLRLFQELDGVYADWFAANPPPP